MFDDSKKQPSTYKIFLFNSASALLDRGSSIVVSQKPLYFLLAFFEFFHVFLNHLFHSFAEVWTISKHKHNFDDNEEGSHYNGAKQVIQESGRPLLVHAVAVKLGNPGEDMNSCTDPECVRIGVFDVIGSYERCSDQSRCDQTADSVWQLDKEIEQEV